MIGLHVDSVRKDFGIRRVLNDVFLSCEVGEIVGLLGRNGSGKSSLLKIVLGSCAADYKFVSVDHIKTGGLYSIRNLINYLPQDNFLPGHLTIKSIVSCFCDRSNAMSLMKHDLVNPFLNKKVWQLSTGERRLIEISLLLNSTAKYLLLDEPFNGVAPMYVEVIKDLIRSNVKDKGFVITGQDYRNVIDLSSRIILMKDGNTLVIKEASDLVDLGYLPGTADLSALSISGLL
jgi:ABC-type multidrug transport system ATPase subunit